MPTQEKPLHSALLEIIQLCLKEVAERLHSGASPLARGYHQHEWERRAAFIPHLTPMAEAVSLAKSAGENPDLPAVLLADVADNPGGGGRGNTPDLLLALLEVGAQCVVMGVFTDPAICAKAHLHGVGARFEADFNSQENTLYSTPFSAQVSVLGLHDGKGVGRRGQLAGCNFDLGPSALLQIGGIKLVVITHRHQCHEPAFLSERRRAGFNISHFVAFRFPSLASALRAVGRNRALEA